MAWLRRWLAACLLLSMGAALAAPLVQPRTMELICSGAGAMKLLAPAGAAHPGGHGGAGMDCLLCLLESAPPGVLPPRLPALPPAVQAPAPPPASFLLASMAALPPARAPPVSPVP